MTPQFVRFNELNRAHVNRDLQVHTVATDGEATIEELIGRARQLELAEIAFTEHVRRTSGYFHGFADEVRRHRRDAPLQVYVGVETKALDVDGTLDAPPEALAEVELVLGSVHRFPDGDGRLIAPEALSYEDAARRELALALGLVRWAPIHVLAHPGGMCQRAFGRFPEEYFVMLMEAALERGVAIEINTAYTRDLDGFLALCRRVNPLISVGSDVHRVSDLGHCRDALLARGIGCA
jgi:putative hydrolase